MRDNELSKVDQEQARKIWKVLREIEILGALALNGGVIQVEDLEARSAFECLLDKYKSSLLNTPLQPIIEPLDEPAHKQVVNRRTETDSWHTVIVSSTEWDNFYALRTSTEAQPEIRVIAKMMLQNQLDSTPITLEYDEWHLPLIQDFEKDLALEDKIKVAIGRCARVSYLTHEGKRSIEADVTLYERLVRSGHMSPTEHVARPMTKEELSINKFSGNYQGWHQHRKDISHEENFGALLNSLTDQVSNI